MRKNLIAVLTVLAVACIAVVADDMSPVGVALKVGTPGVGAEGTLRIIDSLNLRVGANYLGYEYDDELEDVEYEFDIGFFSVPLMLDWHPFGGNWRISIAAVYNDSDVRLKGRPSENVTIGENEYTSEQVGTLSGKVELQRFAPYIGVGFGNAAMADQRWIFVFDLGIVYLSYDVSLSADGLLASDPQFQQDLQEEEDDIQDDADEWKIYPILSFGVGFHF